MPAKAQTDLLALFFGNGRKGAEARAVNFVIPTELTRETLQWYLELALRYLEEEIGNEYGRIVQTLRLGLVTRALR
jgi:hypothetical protein